MAEAGQATVLNDRYQLAEELGRGGMGAVFRGHDIMLDRDVAVKLLSESGLGTEGRERMLREAQAIAKLNHPNIVQVYDAGQLDGTPFIVMEMVEGESLHQRPPQDFPGMVQVAQQICAALAHAHENGIVHRDLKPENVIIEADGTTKLMDFGLARSVASRMTTEGEIVGTVFYLAPELALGQDFDGRADLYSLGVMLYELTAGELPFAKGDPLTVISQHIHATVVPPRTKNPSIPPLLEQLILQLLSKDPAERPESAVAVRLLLEAPSLLDPQAETDREQSLIARIARGRFVGRLTELKQAKALWAQAAAGQGQTLLISGEPGIGKTRFLRELVTHVEVSGGLALIGEAYEEAGAPYAPFAQILRRALQRAAQEGVQISEINLADLLVLAPELRPAYPNVPPNPSLKPEAEQQRQFESVVALLSAVGERAPTLLAIDDGHWADSGSLALLRHLARRTRRQSVLLVVTYREVELDEARPLNEALLDLDRNRLATRLKLARFTREEAGELLHAFFEEEITPDFLAAIYRETEGNPFFIEEVCKTLVEAGKVYFENGRWHRPSMDELAIPQSVRMAIQSRISALPEPTQDVLRLAAILGREFEYETLAEASELDEDALIGSLEAAQQAQLIEEVNGTGEVTFSFVHALIPSTLAEGVRTLRRRKLHRRVGDAIQKARPENYEAIAYHYEEAGDDALALEYYLKAGERSARAYANPEAERHFLAALDLVEHKPERARLLGELALVQSRQGKFELALERWLEGIKLYGTLGEQEPMARYYARAARAAWEAGDLRRGLSLGQEGIQALQGAPNSPGLADLLHETGRALYFNAQHEEAEPMLRNALDMAEKTDAPVVRIEALVTLGTTIAIARPRSAQEGKVLLDKAVELGRSNNLPDQESRALNNLGLIESEYLADLSKTGSYYLRAAELARATGSAASELFYLANACSHALGVGDLKWASERLPGLLEAVQELASPGIAAKALRHTNARLVRYSGQLEAALTLFRELFEDGRETADVFVPTVSFAEVAVETRQDIEEALSMIDEASHGHQFWAPGTLLLLKARLHVAQGHLPEARLLLEQVKTEAGGQPIGMSQAVYGLAQAELAVAERDWEAARLAYAQSVEFQGRVGLRWYRARTLWDWAEALIAEAKGQATDRAREVLEEARTEFESMGAPIYAERIRARLNEF
ncbi:MAG: serine/threonine-protein kinase PknK [Anaerolineales bacterium]